ncbi:hypothetical protein BpHYR1_001485 [Brachionus plicatilis]|uniref:Uncharacterized protein n=1 Tax=Brachionus plicatilis TaxID=10195 RepID=A0A3M7QJW8_BRAPC|nr:hypothetical protein BpHYR1_001485 [Brachionus plicatilis]
MVGRIRNRTVNTNKTQTANTNRQKPTYQNPLRELNLQTNQTKSQISIASNIETCSNQLSPKKRVLNKLNVAVTQKTIENISNKQRFIFSFKNSNFNLLKSAKIFEMQNYSSHLINPESTQDKRCLALVQIYYIYYNQKPKFL